MHTLVYICEGFKKGVSIMRKKPFYRPAVARQMTYDNQHYTHPIANQPYSVTSQPPLAQTPFTQYAKPRQPDDWYQTHQGPTGYTPSSPYENADHASFTMPDSVGAEHPFHYGPSSYAYPEEGGSPGYQQPPQTNMGFPQPPPQPPYSQDGGYPNAGGNPVAPQTMQEQPNGILSQFQNGNGQIDVDKMLTTVGQLANTYHQVAPIIKQFGSFMKNFR